MGWGSEEIGCLRFSTGQQVPSGSSIIWSDPQLSVVESAAKKPHLSVHTQRLCLSCHCAQRRVGILNRRVWSQLPSCTPRPFWELSLQTDALLRIKVLGLPLNCRPLAFLPFSACPSPEQDTAHQPQPPGHTASLQSPFLPKVTALWGQKPKPAGYFCFYPEALSTKLSPRPLILRSKVQDRREVRGNPMVNVS